MTPLTFDLSLLVVVRLQDTWLMTAIGLVLDIAHDDLLKIVYVWLPFTFDPSMQFLRT